MTNLTGKSRDGTGLKWSLVQGLNDAVYFFSMY